METEIKKLYNLAESNNEDSENLALELSKNYNEMIQQKVKNIIQTSRFIRNMTDLANSFGKKVKDIKL